MKRLVIIALSTVVASYLGLCALLFVKQRAFLYPAPQSLDAPTFMKRVDVPAGTFFLWNEVEGNGPVVVRFHGNGEQVAWCENEARFWANQGVSFAAVEYPGYPDAKGETTEAAILDASEAALKWLVEEKKIDRARIVLEGQSLGTGVAVRMADRKWGSKLVLLSPYTSITDVAGRAFPYFPTRLLLRDRWESNAFAAALALPTLAIHGTDDEVIPFELGKSLSSQIPGAKFVEVKGAGHNDLWAYPEVKTALGQFVVGKP
ncbi:MAG: alpha/beta hydrolase [Archangium sp.]